ncbi:hypothetical protein ABFI44_005015, partial [Salmonella enterica]
MLIINRVDPNFWTEVERRAKNLLIDMDLVGFYQLLQSNRKSVLRLKQACESFLYTEYCQEDIVSFWLSLQSRPEVIGLIDCFGSRRKMIIQRGLNGESYSIAVLYVVVRDLMNSEPVNN